MPKNSITKEESVILQSIIAVDGTSRKEVVRSIDELLSRAQEAGLIKEVITDNGVTYYPNNNKGGEKTETPKSPSKISKEDRELCKFLIENKNCYKGKKIRGLDIWGIGKNAITLGNIRIEAFTDGTPTGCGPIRQCDNKEFHNFFKKINKKNSFDDGVQLAKEIIKEYGYLSWKEEQEKYNKEINKFYKENY